MSKLGFGVEELCMLTPGLVYISLSAYSHSGPWQSRHGYDSLVQSATGIVTDQSKFNDLPKHLPCQSLDYIAGFICTFGAMVALHKRATEGGSCLVRTSLVQVAAWLKNLGLIATDWNNLSSDYPHKHLLTQTHTELGLIEHLLPVLHLSTTPLLGKLPIVAIGSNSPSWI